MRVLAACEVSGQTRRAFEALGHDCWSCDIQESDDHSSRHIKGDVLEVIDDDWDLIIAFPPCTHLCSSGARWWPEKRADGRQQEAIEFFLRFTELKCPWAIENPVGIMSRMFRKPDQIIQPWQFGCGEVKTTCLWLSGLPLLRPTNIVEGREQWAWRLSPSHDRSKKRSETYPGIAEAMASQWGSIRTATQPG